MGSITCAVPMMSPLWDGTQALGVGGVGQVTASAGQGLSCPFPRTDISKCLKTLILAVFHNHPLALELASEWKDYTVSLQVPHIHPHHLMCLLITLSHLTSQPTTVVLRLSGWSPDFLYSHCSILLRSRTPVGGEKPPDSPCPLNV